MIVKQIYNAGCIYEANNGQKLLADPWLTPGAFEGSWMAYPPLETKVEDLLDVDYLFISHIHPDHFDKEVLKKFRKSIPIAILSSKPNFLKKALEALGMTSVIEISNSESILLGPFKITLFKPFSKHPFEDASVDNMLDSAALIEADGQAVLNCNDNTPTLEAAKQLAVSYPNVDLLQIKDSLAGPYPSCFPQLSLHEMLIENKKLILRQHGLIKMLVSILKPRFVQPFAASYRLGGKLASKNSALGILNPEQSLIQMSNVDSQVRLLEEKDSLDLSTGIVRIGRPNLRPQPQVRYLDLWDKVASNITYPYESDPEILGDFPIYKMAAERVIDKAKRLGSSLNMRIAIAVSSPSSDVIRLVDMFQIGEDNGKTTQFTMDARILQRILHKQGHWNNFETGCHVEIERFPDAKEYSPDLVTLMSFYYY